jgi:hypothetical protein
VLGYAPADDHFATRLFALKDLYERIAVKQRLLEGFLGSGFPFMYRSLVPTVNSAWAYDEEVSWTPVHDPDAFIRRIS